MSKEIITDKELGEEVYPTAGENVSKKEAVEYASHLIQGVAKSLLAGKTLADEHLLRESSRKNTAEFHAIEAVLKGVELPMPEGESFPDHAGNKRTEFRARWWGRGEARPTPRSMIFPPREFSETPLESGSVNGLPGLR